MHGLDAGVQTRYGMEIAVMKEMGWGPQDLLSAPDDMIEEIAIRMGERAKWEKKKRQYDEDMAKSG